MNETITIGCGCAACQSSTNNLANSEAQYSGLGGEYAPGPAADPITFANYLTNGYWQDSGSTSRSWTQDDITFSLTGFTASQKDGLRLAFDLWSDVADISFTEVSSGANMSVSVGSDGSAYSSSSVSNGIILSSSISIDTSKYGWINFNEVGDYALMTALHEIGHSLGLGHTGNYNGSATYNNNAQWVNDTHQMTVMSYFNASNVGSDHVSAQGYQYSATPMLIDIVAIQSIYGADYTTRNGDTTYGFNSNAGKDVFDFSLGQAPIAIWDGGGIDTLDLSEYGTSQTIYLTEGNYSSTGDMTNNLVIAFGAEIENAIGGSGNDFIYGNDLNNFINSNAGNDTLFGSLGNDALDGGDGNDTVNYNFNVTDFAFNFINNTTVALTYLLESFTDLVTNIENFIFADGSYTFEQLQTNLGALETVNIRAYWSGGGLYKYNSKIETDLTVTADDMSYSGASGDQLTISRSGYNTTVSILNANAPEDIRIGGSSRADVIIINGVASSIVTKVTAGAGDDIITISTGGISILYGEDGNDTIHGFNSNDRLYGGAGLDVIHGGLGRDNIWGGDDADTINGGDDADWLYGDAGDDIINGDAGNDIIEGGLGNDIINGGDGYDTINGGDGDDVIDGGAGNDRINGGIGNDDISGGLGQDFLYGEEDNDILNGGDSADYLYGGAGNDTLDGDDGNDRIYGGDDDDTINGGNGSDFLYGENGNDIINGATGADRILGGSGNDTIYGGAHDDILNGENGNDRIYGGTGSDKIYGATGEDILIGGSGIDTLFGGVDTEIDIFVFSADEDSEDRIYNFTYGTDKINITDLLSGYTQGVSDINDFALVLHTGSRFDIRVDRDGGGDNFVNTARIFTDLSDSLTAQDLINNGTLIANQSLI